MTGPVEASGGSCHADPRVEIDIADIRDELRRQHDDDRDHRDGQQQLDVVIARRLHERPAETLVVEQRLDDHHAVQEPRELQHDDGEGGDERIPERVLQHDVGKAHALEPGGANILRGHHLGHRGAGHPGNIAHSI